MVNDQEPRYRLVDSNGNVVGSLFQNADGNVEIQDETGTGSVFGPNGIVTPAIDAESVSTDELKTNPTGSVVHLSSDQTVPTGSLEQIEFDSASRDPDNLLNDVDNVLVVPDGFSHARVELTLRWQGTVETDTLVPAKNLSFSFPANGGMEGSNIPVNRFGVSTGFFSVSENDEIAAFVEQVSGSDRDIRSASGQTSMEVLLI